MKSFDDYQAGWKDCKDGTDAKMGQSNDYYRGYNARYTLEQCRGREA